MLICKYLNNESTLPNRGKKLQFVDSPFHIEGGIKNINHTHDCSIQPLCKQGFLIEVMCGM